MAPISWFVVLSVLVTLSWGFTRTGLSKSRASGTCLEAVAVFGGTGVLGRECVYQLLQSGETVVVLARTPANMRVPARVDSTEKILQDPRLTGEHLQPSASFRSSSCCCNQ
jgi:hypothetical protein